MSTTSNAQSQDLTPLLFRICIGFTCIVFLIVLIVGRMIFEGFGVKDSLSDYYYSPSMQNVFIGGLCVLATLLICYRYQSVDTLASFFAGICAIGVAIFPKAPVCQPTNMNCATELQIRIGWAHFAFAGLFLSTIAFIAIALFTQSNQNPLPAKKRERNWIFRVCGFAMLACILGCFFVSQFLLPGNQWLQSLHPVLWFEVSALVLFTIAWMVKGQVMLQDEGLGKSSLPLILTYLRNVLPEAIASFSTIFPAWGSSGKSDPKHSQSSTSATE